MRREWRKVLAIGVLFLAGVGRDAAPQDVTSEGRGLDPTAVRLTIELNWAYTASGAGQDPKGGPGSNLHLELTEGRVVEATAWPLDEGVAARGWGPAEGGGWRLGDAASGRVRARIQTAVDAKLIVRRGDQVVSVPVAAVLERPQRTPSPSPSPLTVAVERLPWDTLSVGLGAAAGSGIVAPGAELPVSIGFNILWPETTDVTVRYSAVLRPARGGEAVARQDRQEVLPTNRAEPSMRVLALPAPPVEGAYVVEVQAVWEPVAREGSRLGRLIRRRKSAVAATSAVRRVSLVVLDPAAKAVAGAAAGGPAERAGRRGEVEVEVDSVDLARSRLLRPLASGRAPVAEPGRSAWAVPVAALIEPTGRDRLRGWLRGGAEADRLERADGSGLAWSAVGLKAAHPDRPHRLTLTVKGGEPSALGVALIEAGDAQPDRPRPRVLLDACASGPPALEEGPPLTFSWVVWPGAAETVLVLVNRSPDAAVRLGSVTLTELDDLPGPPPHEPDTPPSRALGLYLDGAHALDRFGGDSGVVDDWTAATNLAKYLSYCGATAVVVPESLAGRPNRRALDGQADEDASRPARLDVLRRVLERQGCSLWLELSFDGPGALLGLPSPDSAEAVRRGLVRLDGSGNAVGAAYHPLHPDVRRAMRRRVVEALTRDRTPSVPASDPRIAAGLVIRLGAGPTLLGTPDTGVDDATYARFVRETFSPETAQGVPGLGTEGSDRFAVRLRYLAGAGRMPWLTWRSRAMASLYAELGAAAQEAVPGVVLAVVTPALDGGPAGSEARRVRPGRPGARPGVAERGAGPRVMAGRPDGSRRAPRGVAVNRRPGARPGDQPRPGRDRGDPAPARPALDDRRLDSVRAAGDRGGTVLAAGSRRGRIVVLAG